MHHPITIPYTIIMNLHIPSNAESFKITTSIIFFYFLAEFLTDFLIKQDSIQQTETEIRTMTTRTFFIIEALFHFQLGNQKSATITDLINPMKWTVPTIKDLVVIVVSVFTCVWCKYTKISRNITNSKFHFIFITHSLTFLPFFNFPFFSKRSNHDFVVDR